MAPHTRRSLPEEPPQYNMGFQLYFSTNGGAASFRRLPLAFDISSASHPRGQRKPSLRAVPNMIPLKHPNHECLLSLTLVGGRPLPPLCLAPGNLRLPAAAFRDSRYPHGLPLLGALRPDFSRLAGHQPRHHPGLRSPQYLASYRVLQLSQQVASTSWGLLVSYHMTVAMSIRFG